SSKVYPACAAACSSTGSEAGSAIAAKANKAVFCKFSSLLLANGVMADKAPENLVSPKASAIDIWPAILAEDSPATKASLAAAVLIPAKDRAAYPESGSFAK